MILPKRNPHMYGKQSLIRSSANSLPLSRLFPVLYQTDDTSLNVERGEEERLNKLYVLEGSKPMGGSWSRLQRDIGAIAKLNSVQTGDSLAAKTTPVLYPKAVIPNTLYLQEI